MYSQAPFDDNNDNRYARLQLQFPLESQGPSDAWKVEHAARFAVSILNCGGPGSLKSFLIWNQGLCTQLNARLLPTPWPHRTVALELVLPKTTVSCQDEQCKCAIKHGRQMDGVRRIIHAVFAFLALLQRSRVKPWRLSEFHQYQRFECTPGRDATPFMVADELVYHLRLCQIGHRGIRSVALGGWSGETIDSADLQRYLKNFVPSNCRIFFVCPPNAQERKRYLILSSPQFVVQQANIEAEILEFVSPSGAASVFS